MNSLHKGHSTVGRDPKARTDMTSSSDYADTGSVGLKVGAVGRSDSSRFAILMETRLICSGTRSSRCRALPHLWTQRCVYRGDMNDRGNESEEPVNSAMLTMRGSVQPMILEGTQTQRFIAVIALQTV